MWRPLAGTPYQVLQPSCIVDVPLALSPYGLACTLRLARATRVWLSPTVWAIVDDPAFFLGQDDLVRRLAGARGGQLDDSVGLVRSTVEQWRRARDEYGLDVREGIFWPAAKQQEAVVPKGGDGRLVERLDALTFGLECRRRNGGAPGEQIDVLADCARDTLALAAALCDDRPVVLTTRSGSAAPELGRYLEAVNIACHQVQDVATMRLLRTALASTLIPSGLVELVAADVLQLVAFNLFVPGALWAPLSLLPADDDDEEPPPRQSGAAVAEGCEARFWDHTIALCYELR